VALEERVLLRVERRSRLGTRVAARTSGALSRDDRAQAAERVYPELWH
jgi:hypothetical protein